MDPSRRKSSKFFAQRIGGESFGPSNGGYKFEKIKRAKRESAMTFPSRAIIDMGVGEPDGMAADSTIKCLQEEVLNYDNRGYADNGCERFKWAVADYMKDRFGVRLDPRDEIIHSIGTKAALSILPLCFVNPGDIVLHTVPGYPIFATHSKYLLGDAIGLPLLAKNGYLPDFDELPDELWPRVKVVVVNYPNNPTGACATKEFFQKLVGLAREKSFVVINDAAYADLTFEKKDMLSILSIDGAKSVCLELHSMSKGFNMTGWRIGWVCGGADLVQAYGFVKDNTDSGQFLAIQKAAAATLTNATSLPKNNAKRYRDRMEKVIPVLRDCGFRVECPKAGFYLYTGIPRSAENFGKIGEFSSADDFAQWMIKELGIVVVPWDDAERAVRLSMTFGMKNITDDEILKMFRERMTSAIFRF